MKLLVIGMMLVLGVVFWGFVGLEKSGRMSDCMVGEVVWSSDKGFNPCVNLGE